MTDGTRTRDRNAPAGGHRAATRPGIVPGGSSDGQISTDAAEIYESFFVPALFAEWAPRVARSAGVQPGMRVLDVACGTGVLARECARLTGDGSLVAGLDPNEGMLAVARGNAPAIDWRCGRAEAPPFADETFDAVVSQFGLMFFADRATAIAQMRRVLKPDGRLAVAVFAGIDRSPGYRDMIALLQRLFGTAMADELRAPFALGNRDALRSLFEVAGFRNVSIETIEGTAHFPSIEDWVFTDVKGWTLADRIDGEQYRVLLAEAQSTLQGHVCPDGKVSFANAAHIVSAKKP